MTDIFTNDAPVTPEPVVDETTDFLTALVGEGKQYKDAAALAKAAFHKEQTIVQRERELAGLRQELATRNRLEDIADRLSQPAPEPLTPPAPVQREQGLTDAGLTPEAVQKIVAETVAKERVKAVQDVNRQNVVSKLRETFGDNYSDAVRQKLTSLGLSDGQANSMAAENPKAFFAMLGVAEGQPRPATQPDAGVFAPPRSSTSATFSPKAQTKDLSYYEAMRTSADPKVREKYWSVPVQNEMHNQALAARDPNEWFK